MLIRTIRTTGDRLAGRRGRNRSDSSVSQELGLVNNVSRTAAVHSVRAHLDRRPTSTSDLFRREPQDAGSLVLVKCFSI
jgi:hypothetical protein